MTERIDAHVHLWNRELDPQEWIDPVSMTLIDRDFGVDDVESMLEKTGMDRSIVVQSSNSLEESVRLSRLDARGVAGLVGWLDLTGDVVPQLEKLRDGANVPLVGLRHLAHIDPDPEWLLRRDVSDGIDSLAAEGLVFEFVVRDWQIPQAAIVVSRHADVSFVLDHLGGPMAGDASPARWEAAFRDLARLPNVACKLSGLTSGLTPGGWTAEDLRPVVEIALDSFDPSRLVYGSDWPLAELGGGAQAWQSSLDALLEGLSVDERTAVFGGTATEIYSLD